MDPSSAPIRDVYDQVANLFDSEVSRFAKIVKESATLFLMGFGTTIFLFTLSWDSAIAEVPGVSRLPQAESIAAIIAATVILLVGGLGRMYLKIEGAEIKTSMDAAADKVKEGVITMRDMAERIDNSPEADHD